MKRKLYSVATLFCLSSAAFAQLSDSLRINYDGTKGGQFCNMTGSTECYYYSGAGSSGPNFAWEHIVGNWGAGDSIGKMKPTGQTDKWTITIHIPDYYTDSTTCTNPAAPGATIYKIGVVFVNADGTKEGKDNSCNEFFIINVNTDTVRAVDGDGDSFVGLTAQWAFPAGVNTELSNVTGISLAPNPSSSQVRIGFEVTDQADRIEVKVLNSIGQEIATVFDGSRNPGNHTMVWDGTMNGSPVDNGIYFVNITNGSEVVSKRLMIIR
jgi:hypothetical protein